MQCLSAAPAVSQGQRFGFWRRAWSKWLPQRDLVARMEAMLRRLEYVDDGRCPECGLMAMRHRKGCEFGALIRDMEARG